MYLFSNFLSVVVFGLSVSKKNLTYSRTQRRLFLAIHFGRVKSTKDF